MEKLKLYRPVPPNSRISSPFGWRIDPVTKKEGSFHNGIDFAVPIGTEITAAASGHIIRIGFQNELDKAQGFGLRIIQLIRYGTDEFYLTYAHLSEIWVHEGQTIEPGKGIGKSGNTGRSTGPHLHFQARAKNSAIYKDIEFMDFGTELGAA